MGEPHPTLKRDEIPFAVALGPSASSCSSSYRYKNNLRELIHIAINDCHPKNMELALHGHTDGHLLLDAIEIDRQRNRMMCQTMGFRHAVVDAHNGDLVAVMHSPDDAYDYCDYFATVRRDATVLDLWAEI